MPSKRKPTARGAPAPKASPKKKPAPSLRGAVARVRARPVRPNR